MAARRATSPRESSTWLRSFEDGLYFRNEARTLGAWTFPASAFCGQLPKDPLRFCEIVLRLGFVVRVPAAECRGIAHGHESRPGVLEFKDILPHSTPRRLSGKFLSVGTAAAPGQKIFENNLHHRRGFLFGTGGMNYDRANFRWPAQGRDGSPAHDFRPGPAARPPGARVCNPQPPAKVRTPGTFPSATPGEAAADCKSALLPAGICAGSRWLWTLCDSTEPRHGSVLGHRRRAAPKDIFK